MGYRLLTLVGLLVAVAMLGQGLAQGGYIAGRDEWLDPEVATVLLIAGGAMLIAVMTLRAFPGMAAVEMGLTGIVALVGFAFVNPVQRSLAAYGAIALVLAVAALVLEVRAAPASRTYADTEL